MQKEIRIALDAAEEKPEGAIFLIPVRLEVCDVPRRLNRWHWVDLFQLGGYEKLLVALRRRMAALHESTEIRDLTLPDERRNSSYELSNARLTPTLGPLDDPSHFVFCCVISTMVSVVVMVITRALLQEFGLTLTYDPATGWLQGLFQGVLGAFIWGPFLAGGLGYWFFAERSEPCYSGKKPIPAATSGAAAGLGGGVLVTISFLYAQRPESLYEKGWILYGSASPITSFTETGLGYSMIVFGIALGLASGLSTARILLTPKWTTFVARQSTWTSPGKMARELAGVFGNIVRHSWYFSFWTMTPAALLLFAVLSTLSRAPLLLRVVGECFSLILGGKGLSRDFYWLSSFCVAA